MRGASPPAGGSRPPSGQVASSQSRRFGSTRIQSPAGTRKPDPSRASKETIEASRASRLALNGSLSQIGTSPNWSLEEAQAAHRDSSARLFQAPSATASSKGLARKAKGSSTGASSTAVNSTASLGPVDTETSPREQVSPDGSPKRKTRPITTDKTHETLSQPFRHTTVLAQSKMMKASLLRDAAEKNTRRSHVLQHLGNGNRGAPTEPELLERAASREQTPYEVLARGPRAHIHFLKALKFGTQRPRTLKLMFVGQGRAGKTSTLRRLTGRGFDAAEPSTHGVACESTFKTCTDLVSSWRVLGCPELEVHRNELKTSFAREVVARIKEEQEEGVNSAIATAVHTALRDLAESPDSPKASDFKPQLVHDSHEPASPNLVDQTLVDAVNAPVAEKMPVDLITRYLEHPEDGTHEEAITLKTWDFAGQQEYYAMHHLFLTNRGVYLVVTRLDLWLPGTLAEEDLPLFEQSAVVPEGDSEILCDGPDGAADPPLHALTFWLSSIHIHAPNSIVVIVGTHKDKISGQEEEVYARVEEEIQTLLQRVPGVDEQLVVNQEEGLCFFPVDNSLHKSGDGPANSTGEDANGISALREALDQVARESLAEGGIFGEALPLKWVQLREELGEMATGTTGEPGEQLPMTALFVVSHQHVMEIARGLGIREEEELGACLQYLHDTGSIVFFDEPGLREHVVLNPQWLTDAMAHVLNCPRVVRGANSGARRLREKGELDAELLRKHLWKAPKFRDHTRILLPLLHRYDLLLPYQSGEGCVALSRSGSAPALAVTGDVASYIADCQTLLVPCLLPSAPPLPPGMVAPEVPVWDALFFDFHGMLCRLLPTLFPKLLVAATRNPQIEGPLSSMGVFRDSFKLLWGTAQLAFDLLPSGRRPQVLRVRLERHVGSGIALDARNVSGLPVHIVRELLTLVRTSLSQHNHLTFTAGILCEHCHARGRKLSEQHHVIDLSELVGEAEFGRPGSSSRLPPGNIVCRAQQEVVEIPDFCWASQWRKDVASRSLGKGAGASNSSASIVAGEEGNQDLFSDGDSILTRFSAVDEALLLPASSIPSSVSSELPTCRTDRVLVDTVGTWRLNLLYASPLCYTAEVGWNMNAEPQDLPQINVEAELALLWEAMSMSEGENLPFERSMDGFAAAPKRCSVVADLATTSKIRQLLTSGAGGNRRLLLHLSLHCVEGGRALLMEDGNGGAHAISLVDFEDLIRAGGGLGQNVGFVFVNACSSDQLGRVLIALGVPHVICCQGAVFDAVARCFTKAFYLACAQGFTIGRAFEIAKAEVRASPQPGLRGEAEKYILLGLEPLESRESEMPFGKQHAVSLAEVAASSGDTLGLRSTLGNTTELSTSSCWRPSEAGQLPPRTEDFCGRGRDLWAIQAQLSSQRRCMTCVGEEGVGKSALLMELARFVSSPGRRFSSSVVYVGLGANEDVPHSSFAEIVEEGAAPSEAGIAASFSLRRFLTDIVEAVCATAGENGHSLDTAMMDEESVDGEGGGDPLGWSSRWCQQLLKATLIRIMRQLENRRGGAESLLILDDMDAYLADPALAEDVRKALTEVLLRTERTMLLLGSRRPLQGTLGSHKVVALSLAPLKPADAARLFLWRVHRPLTLRDLSAAGIGSDLPLVYDPRNRQMVLAQISSHPLLQVCRGHPGEIRRIADTVRPGSDGEVAPTLYELYEEMFGNRKDLHEEVPDGVGHDI